MSAPLEPHKKIIREFVVADLREALLEIRAGHPGMRIEDLMQLLRRERPGLWQEGQRLESLAGDGRARVSG